MALNTDPFFSVSQVSSLRKVPPGGSIHVIGVAGVAMAQLAVALSKKGYRVSGSDKEFYEPTGSFLRRSSVTISTGYEAAHIPHDVSLVVIGNAVSISNPEVQAVKSRSLSYTIFPRLFFEIAIEGRHSMVVSGTHGKTTTSGMLSWVLSEAKRFPSFFVGGALHQLEASLEIGDGSESVVEGDEYDSAFFAKVPKFTFYHPNTLIVTSIEYDHADIYPDLESIIKEFSALVTSRKKGDLVLACIDTETVRSLVPVWRKDSAARVITYGEHTDADIRIQSVCDSNGMLEGSCTGEILGSCTIRLRLPGMYNLKNAIAVAAAAVARGVPLAIVLDAIERFQGVKRRQEVRAEGKGITLIEDFAHHPTAVKETLLGIALRFPKRKIWAIFEPRSATSRRSVFQKEYVAAFSEATRVTLCNVTAKTGDAEKGLINVSTLSDEISKSGVLSSAEENPAAIAALVTKEMKHGDVIVVMSNGSFGGLIDSLVKAITTYHTDPDR